MKFYLAILFWLLLAGILSLGVVRAVHGSLWLLLLSLLVFILAMAKYGCLHHEPPHEPH